MNKHLPTAAALANACSGTGAATRHVAPRLPGGAAAPNASTTIGAANVSQTVESPTGEAGAPNLSIPSKPWGNQPICPNCNRGARYSCICDPFFEEDGEPDYAAERRVAESLRQIDWFGWALAEDAAVRP